ncbi:MAG: hypothetical protein IKW98_05770 [Prevotella sp.]|nr:hypothetical protein [Prevotella sp.]
MPHTITYTEEIEEHGYCQQRPELHTGDKYLHEVEGKKRLRIVQSVHFDKYVWENVAQWTTIIEEFFEEEYTLTTVLMNFGQPCQSEVPVFVANGMMGVLTCDKEKVNGELIIPSKRFNVPVKGVAPFGFYDCEKLTKVIFDARVVIAYEYAFAKSGITEMVFNEIVPVFVHTTAIDHCDSLPKFDRLFDRPFPGKYMICGGELFHKEEEELRRLHFIF